LRFLFAKNRANERYGDFSPMIAPCIILPVTTHRLWGAILIAAGITVFGFARQISTAKSSAWARFYQRHPNAAEKNPLSVHAGTERSIRLGAFMWRAIGIGIALNGLIRLE
jgi:hypothetical protein